MKIIFDKRQGVLRDLFDSISWVLNDCHREMYSKFEANVNKDVERAVKALSKIVNKNKDLLDVYFKAESPLNNPIDENSDIWGCSDKDELINFIRKLSGQQIKYEAIKSMGEFKDDDDAKEKINEILQSDIKILDLIESLKVDDNMKWKILKLINNSEKWVREFMQFIEVYIPQYVQIMEKYEKSIELFNNYIEENINNGGIKFLEKILGNFNDVFLKFDDYEEIYVNTVFFNSISCGFHESSKKLYIFLGRDFEATAKRLSGENVFEKNINIFKNLCDKTRFNILIYLMDGEVYSQEIANKYGISMATVSYHMNYLASVNLVKSEKRAQKTYYVVNKDTLRESIEFLNKTLSLQIVGGIK